MYRHILKKPQNYIYYSVKGVSQNILTREKKKKIKLNMVLIFCISFTKEGDTYLK